MQNKYLLLAALFFISIYANAQLAYEWSDSRGYSDSEDYTADIQVDDNGNTYAAAVYGNTPTNSYFSTVIKYDATGTIVAGVTIGNSTPNNDVVIEKIVVKGQYVYVTGRFAGTVDFDDLGPTASITSYGGYDAFIAKYNSSLGTLAWVKKVGGTNFDTGKDIAVKSNEEVFVVGEYNGSISFQGAAGMNGFGQKDIFFCKLNSSGDFVWVKGMGGNVDDYVNGICTDNIFVYILGTYRSSSLELNASGTNQTVSKVGGTSDMFIASYATGDGSFWFGKNIGGNDEELGQCIEYIGNGNFAIGGRFYNSVDFDPSGGTEILTATNANTSSFLALYNFEGNIQWAKTTSNTSFGYTATYAIEPTPDGSIYTTGYYGDLVNFGSGIPNLTSNNNSEDIFIAKYSPAGNCLWAKGLGSETFDRGLAIAATNTNIIVGGKYRNTMDLDFGTGTYNIIPTNVMEGNGPGEDAFIVSYNIVNTAIEQTEIATISIYPNPAVDELMIEIPGLKQNALFTITDVAGKVMFSETLTNTKTAINIQTLASGIYIWQVNAKAGKLIVK